MTVSYTPPALSGPTAAAASPCFRSFVRLRASFLLADFIDTEAAGGGAPVRAAVTRPGDEALALPANARSRLRVGAGTIRVFSVQKGA